MFEEKARFIIQEKYIELVSAVIDELQALPIQNIQDHTDSTSFDNIWEAFVNHLPSENNPFTYTPVIEDVCRQMIQTMTLTELKLLWLVSEGHSEWDEAEDFPAIDQLINEVTEELLLWVEQEAEEPEFEEEYDDEENEEEESYDDEDMNQTRH